MSRISLVLIGKKIETARSILVAGHARPDFDSAGSCLALYFILKNLGKKVSVASSIKDRIWDNFKNDISRKDFALRGRYDLAIFLDYGKFYRVEQSGLDYFKKHKIPLISIDHHVFDDQRGDLVWLDTKKTSTAEMIFDLAVSNHWPIEDKVAFYLLLGIYHDTGGFLYEKVTKGLFRKIARLYRESSVLFKIWMLGARWENIEQLKIFGKCLSAAEIDKDLGFVSCVVKRDSAVAGDDGLYLVYHRLADFLISITGVKISLVLRRLKGSKKWKGSLRGAPDINRTDLNKIASYFGGGGHFNASGFESNLSSAKIISTVKRLIKGRGAV